MQPSFGTLLAEVRAEKGSELDGAFTRIIHEATDQLMDRLKNGDPVLVAGQIKRSPCPHVTSLGNRHYLRQAGAVP